MIYFGEPERAGQISIRGFHMWSVYMCGSPPGKMKEKRSLSILSSQPPERNSTAGTRASSPGPSAHRSDLLPPTPSPLFQDISVHWKTSQTYSLMGQAFVFADEWLSLPMGVILPLPIDRVRQRESPSHGRTNYRSRKITIIFISTPTCKYRQLCGGMQIEEKTLN